MDVPIDVGVLKQKVKISNLGKGRRCRKVVTMSTKCVRSSPSVSLSLVGVDDFPSLFLPQLPYEYKVTHYTPLLYHI